MPIIVGVNKDDGVLVWFEKNTLEEIFNSSGKKSFSPTALGTDLGEVTSMERLLTTFYLGRWTVDPSVKYLIPLILKRSE